MKNSLTTSLGFKLCGTQFSCFWMVANVLKFLFEWHSMVMQARLEFKNYINGEVTNFVIRVKVTSPKPLELSLAHKIDKTYLGQATVSNQAN